MFTHCKQNVGLRPRNHNLVQLHGKFLGHKIWHASQKPCLCTDPPGICLNFRSHLKKKNKLLCHFLFISDTVVIRFVIKRGFWIMPLKACLPFHWCLLPFIGVPSPWTLFTATLQAAGSAIHSQNSTWQREKPAFLTTTTTKFLNTVCKA